MMEKEKKNLNFILILKMRYFSLNVEKMMMQIFMIIKLLRNIEMEQKIKMKIQKKEKMIMMKKKMMKKKTMMKKIMMKEVYFFD
jgi:hypothetical protein